MIGVFTLYQPLYWFSSLLHVLSLNITVRNNHGNFPCVVSIAIFNVFITVLFSTRSETLSRYLSNTRFSVFTSRETSRLYPCGSRRDKCLCTRAFFRCWKLNKGLNCRRKRFHVWRCLIPQTYSQFYWEEILYENLVFVISMTLFSRLAL